MTSKWIFRLYYWNCFVDFTDVRQSWDSNHTNPGSKPMGQQGGMERAVGRQVGGMQSTAAIWYMSETKHTQHIGQKTNKLYN